MAEKCHYPYELERLICHMCKDRPDGWSMRFQEGKGLEIASVYARADGVIAVIPHSSSMYGGILDGEHVCKICFTWDRLNEAEAEAETKRKAEANKRRDEHRQAAEAN